MRRCFGYIVALMSFASVLLTSCRKDSAEIIPRDDLAVIYVEMLMTDQWILNTPNVRLIADTSLVYEPILEKYGYDAADYRKSVDHYMDDPERFAKILKQSSNILDARMAELEKIKAELEEKENLRRRIERFSPDIEWEKMNLKRPERTYIGLPDSLAFVSDTTIWFDLKGVERKDTLYDGIRIVLPEKDTVAVEKTEVPKFEVPKSDIPMADVKRIVAPVYGERKKLQREMLKIGDEHK